MSRYTMLLSILLFVGLIGTSTAAYTQSIQANQENDRVLFAGEHAGMKFEGVFETWEANLSLPPATDPSIVATFNVGSAKTGDSTYDDTLPEGDWFDVENHPTASFQSTSVSKVAQGYEVKGDFTLKGVTKALSFILIDDGKSLVANFKIDRLAHNIGTDSDPDADWVSQYITMTVDITK